MLRQTQKKEMEKRWLKSRLWKECQENVIRMWKKGINEKKCEENVDRKWKECEKMKIVKRKWRNGENLKSKWKECWTKVNYVKRKWKVVSEKEVKSKWKGSEKEVKMKWKVSEKKENVNIEV